MPGKIGKLIDYVQRNAKRGDPDSVIAAVDRFSERQGGLMHIGANKGAVLDRALATSGARRVLELGSFFGYAAVRMGRGLPSDGELITVDADRDHQRATEWLIDFAGLGGRVTAKLGRASDIIGSLQGRFDLVFMCVMNMGSRHPARDGMMAIMQTRNMTVNI